MVIKVKESLWYQLMIEEIIYNQTGFPQSNQSNHIMLINKDFHKLNAINHLCPKTSTCYSIMEYGPQININMIKII